MGVIESFADGEADCEHDATEITRGYTHDKFEDGRCVIEVNIESNNLFDIYAMFLRLLKDCRGFCYVLHDHWDDADEDVFLRNEELNSADKILSHLTNSRSNSIHNGYVTLTTYFDEGYTNLSINDHKRIIVSTYSEDVAKGCSNALEMRSYPKESELISFEALIHHWHYRPSDSLNKDELTRLLKGSGFRDWVPRTEPPADD